MFFGDSLAIEGSPNYPQVLPELLPGLSDAINLSEPGTTSRDWLPSGSRFTDGLLPNLKGADVVFVTVGGNDLQEAFGSQGGPDALEVERDESRLDAVNSAFSRIERNLSRTFAAIRRARPRAAIVYVGYPDYSRAQAWAQRTDTFGLIALRTGIGRLSGGAEAAGADHVVEMLEPTADAGVDSLLADAEHLSPEGHALYAAVLARRLGPR